MAENIEMKNEGRGPETPVDAGSQALSEALRSSFGIVKFVMFLLVCLFLGSGFFTVGPQEQAMIIRLGSPVRTGGGYLLGPGLHWSFPYPIDEYKKVPIRSVQKVTSTVGWWATTPEQEQSGADEGFAGGSINPLVDGYVLTADNNIVHSKADLTYTIADPVSYVFDFVNASNAVQNALDNALLRVGSQFKVDDILTRDVAGFQEAVGKRATELIEAQKLGVLVQSCTVRSRPPRQLKAAFESVVEALAKQEKALDEARSRQNQVLTRAGAETQSRTNTAESDRTRLVKEMSSQAERFKDLLPTFQQNPSLFVHKALADTLSRAMTNVQDKILLPSSPGLVFRPMFNRERPKTEESK